MLQASSGAKVNRSTSRRLVVLVPYLFGCESEEEKDVNLFSAKV